MAEKKKKIENRVTPKGELLYCGHLQTADTKYDDAGIYSTKLVLTRQAAAPMLAELNAALKESVAAAKKGLQEEKRAAKTKADIAKVNAKIKKFQQADLPWFEDEETDTVTFSFKMRASGKTREGKEYTQKPVLVGADNKPLDLDGIMLGNGTIGRVSYEPKPFYTALVGAGVSLRLRAVQILDIREWEPDGSSYGFEADEEYADEGGDDDDADFGDTADDDDDDSDVEDDEDGDDDADF